MNADRVQYSIVCPVKDEVELLPRTLPSFYMVGASEVVLCFDDPPDEATLTVAKRISNKFSTPTKFVFVQRNRAYKFHQAWVRRKGFLEATYNRILTCDIDLVLNRNVLKAVGLVGYDNVGLASCSKFRVPTNISSMFRCFSRNILRKIIAVVMTRQFNPEGLKMTTFTGLYAVSRWHWQHSEDQGIKRLVNPKQALRGDYTSKAGKSTSCPGEDTYLRDCMKQKYGVVYLRDVGATVVRDSLHDHPHVQFEVGRYNALEQERSLLGALIHTFSYLHPYYLQGYFMGRKEKHAN